LDRPSKQWSLKLRGPCCTTLQVPIETSLHVLFGTRTNGELRRAARTAFISNLFVEMITHKGVLISTIISRPTDEIQGGVTNLKVGGGKCIERGEGVKYNKKHQQFEKGGGVHATPPKLLWWRRYWMSCISMNSRSASADSLRFMCRN